MNSNTTFLETEDKPGEEKKKEKKTQDRNCSAVNTVFEFFEEILLVLFPKIWTKQSPNLTTGNLTMQLLAHTGMKVKKKKRKFRHPVGF